MLADLAKVEMPALHVPEVSPDQATVVRADGAAYRLVAGGQYQGEAGRVALTFGTATPVAKWVDASLRALAPCWRSKLP